MRKGLDFKGFVSIGDFNTSEARYMSDVADDMRNDYIFDEECRRGYSQVEEDTINPIEELGFCTREEFEYVFNN